MKKMTSYNPLPACGAALALLGSGLGGTARAAVTITDSTNITLAASQVEAGGDTSLNPDVTGGLGGVLLVYTESGTNTYSCCGGRLGTYGIGNLNDGDIGDGASDGTFALPDTGAGMAELSFASATLIGGIAIYNGYTNRDDGSYTLKDGAGNVLGAWSLATEPIGINEGADSFWLTFNNPVTTDKLVIDGVVGDCCGTGSFREIQVFAAVPEPSSCGVVMGGLIALAGRRRRRC